MFSSRLATFWGALRTSFLGDTARLEPRRNILLVLVLVLSRGLRSRRYALAEFSRARVFCGHAAARRFCSGLKAACARPRGEKLLLAGDTQNVFHTRPHARRSLACVLEMTGGPETVLPSPICLRVGLYFETVISSPAWP